MPQWCPSQLTIYADSEQCSKILDRIVLNGAIDFNRLIQTPEMNHGDSIAWRKENWGIDRNPTFDCINKDDHQTTLLFSTPDSHCLKVIEQLAKLYPDINFRYEVDVNGEINIFRFAGGEKLPCGILESEKIIIFTLDPRRVFIEGILKEAFPDYPEMVTEILSNNGVVPDALENADTLMVSLASNFWATTEGCDNTQQMASNCLSILQTIKDDIEQCEQILTGYV